MARDGSGNYSLPAGNPVVTGTTITITWANSTLTDIATAMTGSVARDGQAAMTGPLNMGSNGITSVTTIVASGAVTAASLIPTSATVPANGMYLSAANTLAFATNSVQRATIDTSGNLVITGSLTAVNAVLSGAITAVGATLTGTITVGGVNVTDFARLSTANIFLGAWSADMTGGGVMLSSTRPSINIRETDAPANEGRWLWDYEGGDLRLFAGSDAGAYATTPLAITRTGTTVDGITLAATVVALNGNLQTPNTSASEAGYKGLPQNSQSVDYTAVLADADKNLHQTGASKTFTIPANASVAYPIGTVLNFTTDNATGCSIAITTDTLRLAGTATTGTRTLTQYGMATALKILATTWLVSGAGLS